MFEYIFVSFEKEFLFQFSGKKNTRREFLKCNKTPHLLELQILKNVLTSLKVHACV